MTRLNIPFRPASGDQEIVEQIIGDFDHIQDISNGQLQAGTNVKTGTPTDPLTGNQNLEGVSDSLARADHAHVIRGVEQLAVTPSGSHFAGRVYFDTTTNQHKVCVDAVAGTYTAFSNVAATDVAVHGSRHGVGAADPLPNLGISSDMMGRSVQTTALPAKVSNIKDNWVNLLTTPIITLAGSQVVTFSGKLVCANFTSNSARFAWRIMDTTPEPDLLVCGSYGIDTRTGLRWGMPVSDIVQQTTGPHTYLLQGQTSQTANGFDVEVDNTGNLLDSQLLSSYLGLVVG